MKKFFVGAAFAAFMVSATPLEKKIAPTKKQLLKRKDLQWEEFGPLKRSEMSENLSFVFSMKKGEISQPIKTATGYQLVMLADYEPERTMSFDEQAIHLERELVEQKRSRFQQNLLTELRSQAIIRYYE